MAQPPKVRRVGPSLVRLLLLISLLVFLALFFGPCSKKSEPPPKEITIDELYVAIDAGNVKDLNIDAEQRLVSGTFRDDKKFTTRVANVDSLEAKALEKGVKVSANPTGKTWVDVVLSLVFGSFGFLIIFLIFIWLMPRSQANAMGKQLKDIKSIKAAIVKPKERYTDVAGCDEAIVELREFVDCLQDPEKYQRFGIRPCRGILLLGPPGTGKTLLAKATAGEAGIPLIALSGSEFVEMFVGVGASRIRDAFSIAKKIAPCIIFIDEFDAIGKRRSVGGYGSHDERDQTLNQLLAEMDGFDSNSKVIVLAATNQPEILDPAVMRSGRFDRKVAVLLPDRKAREAILKIHTRDKPVDETVDLADIAKSTRGFSGADLELVANEAAFLAVRAGKLAISRREMDEGIDKVYGGIKKKNSLGKWDMERVAYHEAGHTLVIKLCPDADPLRKVTILAMGMSGGSTWPKADENNVLKTTKYFTGTLAVLMGGRAAEWEKYNDVSIGAQNDIEQATKLAREMVCEYGFSEVVGQLALAQRSQFLGMSSESLNCSEATKTLVDQEIKRLIDAAYDKAKRLLAENRVKLDAIANSLLEKETLLDSEVDEILGGCSNPT